MLIECTLTKVYVYRIRPVYKAKKLLVPLVIGNLKFPIITKMNKKNSAGLNYDEVDLSHLYDVLLNMKQKIIINDLPSFLLPYSKNTDLLQFEMRPPPVTNHRYLNYSYAISSMHTDNVMLVEYFESVEMHQIECTPIDFETEMVK